MRQLPAQSQWLKAGSTGAPIGVDRENRRINGYVVAQEGVFKSEGRGEFDHKSLAQIVKLMKQDANGTKSRFAHPGLSSDGLGKFLGRAKNPRIDTAKVQRADGPVEIEAVRADLHLSQTAFQVQMTLSLAEDMSHASDEITSMGSYLLDLADSDPAAISSSLVLQVEEEFRLDTHGKRRKDDSGQELPPLWRPTQIHASDIVDTGDAVDGLLSFEPGAELPDIAVRRGFELLNQVFAGQPREVIEARCQHFLQEYLMWRFGVKEKTICSAIEIRRRWLQIVS